MTGMIFDIQRFSIHDGPGIRTTVFFKGCDLRCLWCHNPESQSAKPELMFYKEKCVGCGECRKICPRAFTADCIAEGDCVPACRHGAREISGRTESAHSVAATVLRDKAFYAQSGGGATLSGGEPLLQLEFAVELLSVLKENGVHTAIETAGNVPFSAIETVLPFVDLFLYDIKGIDPEKHKKNTGVSNERIVENARALAETGKDLLFRMPYIPGYNDAEAPAVADFAHSLGRDIELMAYHEVGKGKYASLGRDYPTPDAVPPEPAFMKALAERIGARYEWSGV